MIEARRPLLSRIFSPSKEERSSIASFSSLFASFEHNCLGSCLLASQFIGTPPPSRGGLSTSSTFAVLTFTRQSIVLYYFGADLLAGAPRRTSSTMDTRLVTLHCPPFLLLLRHRPPARPLATSPRRPAVSLSRYSSRFSIVVVLVDLLKFLTRFLFERASGTFGPVVSLDSHFLLEKDRSIVSVTMPFR